MLMYATVPVSSTSVNSGGSEEARSQGVVHLRFAKRLG